LVVVGGVAAYSTFGTSVNSALKSTFTDISSNL